MPTPDYTPLCVDCQRPITGTMTTTADQLEKRDDACQLRYDRTLGFKTQYNQLSEDQRVNVNAALKVVRESFEQTGTPFPTDRRLAIVREAIARYVRLASLDAQLFVDDPGAR